MPVSVRVHFPFSNQYSSFIVVTGTLITFYSQWNSDVRKWEWIKPVFSLTGTLWVLWTRAGTEVSSLQLRHTIDSLRRGLKLLFETLGHKVVLRPEFNKKTRCWQAYHNGLLTVIYARVDLCSVYHECDVTDAREIALIKRRFVSSVVCSTATSFLMNSGPGAFLRCGAVVSPSSFCPKSQKVLSISAW